MSLLFNGSLNTFFFYSPVWPGYSEPKPKELQNFPQMYKRPNTLAIYGLKSQFLHNIFPKTQNLLVGRAELLTIFQNRTIDKCGHKNLP